MDNHNTVNYSLLLCPVNMQLLSCKDLKRGGIKDKPAKQTVHSNLEGSSKEINVLICNTRMFVLRVWLFTHDLACGISFHLSHLPQYSTLSG